MAPQRRSQRQHARQSAAAKAAAATAAETSHKTLPSSMDCALQTDQQAVEEAEEVAVPPPAKRPCRQQLQSSSSPGGTANPQQAGPPAVSQMELERAARIAANQARLAELELPQLAANLAATAAAAQRQRKATQQQQRGISNKRNRSGEQLPLRQSARARGQAPDASTAGGIDYEGRDGRVVLAAFVPERYGSSSGGGDDAAAAAPSRPPPGPLAFSSSNGDEATDAAFLQQLQSFASVDVSRDRAAHTNSSSGSSGSSSGGLSADELVRLQLQPVDVAKLTTQGVSCMAFHPSSSRPIIAAADKSGKVGLWDIDHQAAAAADGDSSSSSGYDGVLMFEPHRDYISSLKWLGPTGAALLTGSYDGTVRRLDVESGVWDLVGGVPSDDEGNNWSAGEVTPDGSTIYLATSAGHLTQLDTRCSPPAAAAPLLISNRKVNTLHLHSDQVHLLSSASDGTVAVWDVRQLAGSAQHTSNHSSHSKLCKPLASGRHYKSSQGAYWEPTGGRRVLSISFDDTLRIWQLDSSTLTAQVTIKHNNNTGRWVMPFRPMWSPAGDGVCVGDLKRGVAVFRDSGTAVGMLVAEALTAIPSRVTMHHGCGLLAAATSSGRVHIFR